MNDDPQTGSAQLQHAGLDAVVGGEASHQHRADAPCLQEFDKPGAAALGQVMVAGAVRMQVRLDPFQTKKS